MIVNLLKIGFGASFRNTILSIFACCSFLSIAVAATTNEPVNPNDNIKMTINSAGSNIIKTSLKMWIEKLDPNLKPIIDNLVEDGLKNVKLIAQYGEKIKTYKLRHATQLKDGHAFMKRGLEKLQESYSKAASNLKVIQNASQYLNKMGIKVDSLKSIASGGLQVIGGALTIVNVQGTVDDMVKSYDEGNYLRYRHKLEEASVMVAVTTGTLVAGAGLAVTLPAGIAIGAGVYFNDQTELLNIEADKKASKKIAQLDNFISEDTLAMRMESGMKKMMQEPVNHTAKYVRLKLKEHFNSSIDFFLGIVKKEINTLDKRRKDVWFDGEGPLLRSQSDLKVYKWLKGQEKALNELKNPYLNKSWVKSFRKKYIENSVVIYKKSNGLTLDTLTFEKNIASLKKPPSGLVNVVKKSPNNSKKDSVQKQPAITDSKGKLEQLRQTNLKLAEALKNDPNNKELKKQLDANAQTYLDLRSSIRKTEPGYGLPIDTSQTVSKKVAQLSSKAAKPSSEEKRNLVREKIKQLNKKKQQALAQSKMRIEISKRNAERKRLIDDLSKKVLAQQEADKKKIDYLSKKVLAQQKADKKHFKNNQKAKLNGLSRQITAKQQARNAKQRELDRLRGKEGSSELTTVKIPNTTSQRVLVKGNKQARKDQMDFIGAIGVIRRFKRQSHEAYSRLPESTKRQLRKIADRLGVRSTRYVYKNISSYYENQLSRFNSMPIVNDHYKTVYSTDSYPLQVRSLVGLTRSEKNKMSQLQSELSNLDASLADLQRQLNDISTYHPSNDLIRNQRNLKNLVVDYLDATKVQIGVNQEAKVNAVTNYQGSFSSITSSVSATAGISTTAAPFIGMELHPKNTSAVFSGSFKIKTQTHTDISGVYNYLSWGTWNATTTPSPRLTFRTDGAVFPLIGGHWLMGIEAVDIPRTGSASYHGYLSGDFVSASGIRSPGLMGGAVNFNANFGSGTLTGNINAVKTGSSASWANGTFTNGRIETGDAGPNHTTTSFHTRLTGGTITAGGIQGVFFGARGKVPAEAGGSWYIDQSNGSAASGIFRAKKQ